MKDAPLARGVHKLTLRFECHRLRQRFCGKRYLCHSSGSVRVRQLARQFDVRWPNLLGVALACLWLSPGPVRSEDAQPITVRPRATSEFVSPGQFFFDRVLAPVCARSKQLVIGRSVNLPSRPRVSRTYGPLRQIGLVGGDRISAELLHWNDDSFQLRLASGQTIVVPTAFVETLDVPPGETDLLDERFESDDSLSGFIDEAVRSNMTIDRDHAASGDRSLRMSSESRPINLTCPPGLNAARVQVWFRAEHSPSLTTGGQVAFTFGESSDANSLVLELDGSRLAIVGRKGLAAQWTTQTVELRSGWHCLTTLVTPHRVLCLVGENLLAAGSGIEAPLHSIRFAPRGNLWIDDLSISRLDDDLTSFDVRFPSVDDTVVTHTGEEFFGRVTQLTPRGITLAGIAGELLMPWSRVATVGFRSADRPVNGQTEPLEGLVARIEWQPFVDRPQLLADRVTVTIVKTDRDGLVVSHPFLGEFPLSWRDLRRIEPFFLGHDLVLDARRVHLGDSIRADFRRPLPDGTEWCSEFVLAAMPEGDVWLSLNVADLEPSGLETPPGSAYLKELRAGRLLTEVLVNNQPAGSLNSHLRFRASPDQPERLRCLLPRDALRTGANSFRLTQRPLTENGSDFDDCELSDLRLEIRAASVTH